MLNQRINELARQAGLNAPYGSEHRGLRDFDYMQFAELIVAECLTTVESVYTPVLGNGDLMQDPHWDGYVQCGVDVMAKIKTKFNATTGVTGAN